MDKVLKNCSVGPGFARFRARREFLWLLVALSLGTPSRPVLAEQLSEAQITRIIKKVEMLPEQAAARPALLKDTVRGGTAVRTGTESRTELTFTDQTLTRLGANTTFTFNEGSRNIDLGVGAMLLYVPKNSGGAKISTAAVTAAITGTTVLIEAHAGGGGKNRSPFGARRRGRACPVWVGDPQSDAGQPEGAK